MYSSDYGSPDSPFDQTRRRVFQRRLLARRRKIAALAVIFCGIIAALHAEVRSWSHHQTELHRLSFEKATVVDIAGKLRDEFGIRIEGDQPEIGGYHFTGALYVNTGEEALELLCNAWHITYRKRDGNTYLLEKKPMQE